MLRNQKGFIYPVTLGFMILFSTLLVMGIEQFLTEKRMLNETEIILKQDYYLLSTVDQLQSYLSANENLDMSGTFQFKEGEASYLMIEKTDTILEIIIYLQITDHDAIFEGTAIYDRNLRKMIKWTEIN